jgi:hypothetical protein
LPQTNAAAIWSESTRLFFYDKFTVSRRPRRRNFYPPGTQIAPAGYSYADSNPFDTSLPTADGVPLLEFFTSPTQPPFTSIAPTIKPATGKPYTTRFFKNCYEPGQVGGVHKPTGPDNDGDED